MKLTNTSNLPPTIIFSCPSLAFSSSLDLPLSFSLLPSSSPSSSLPTNDGQKQGIHILN
eukprot:m.262188 g.262188  ORF g.262188 m.262188 type:complete len:59 (+) comp26795_c0_seq2:73-249(+)